MSGGLNPTVGKTPLSERGPAPVRTVVGFGFWLFLLSDIVMFAVFFAAYAVLSSSTAGGPSGRELFDHDRVLLETCCLLLSSFTCGLMLIGSKRESRRLFYLGALATLALGLGFVMIEGIEFSEMIADGAAPTRSAFLSAFFTLVGAHGLHVTVGLAWLMLMATQVEAMGFTSMVQRRLLCFSLFWHALDIVWIGVFTIVYLGAG